MSLAVPPGSTAGALKTAIPGTGAHSAPRLEGTATWVGPLRVGVDIASATAAMSLAFLLRSILPGAIPSQAGSTYLLLGTLSLPVWVGMFVRARLYSPAHTAGRLDEFRRVINATLSSVAAMAVLAFVLKVDVARSWLGLTALLATATIAGGRTIVRRHCARLRTTGRLLRPVVLVGGNVEALAVCSMLVADPRLGYRVVGFVDDETAAGTALLGGQRVLGSVDETLSVAREVGAVCVIIVTSAISHASSNRLTRQLTGAGLGVELSSSLCDIAASRLFVRPLGRFPVVHVEPTRRDGWSGRAKRAFDITVAAAMGLVAAPILGLAALAIKLDSHGAVHFRQQRVGRNGRLFEVFKLRTMVIDAEGLEAGLRQHNESDGPIFKMRSDPRVTRVGRVLRALSIDELPQLWNVLRGDMSLVGPRPARPSEMPQWSSELHGRLAVRPGMTGMWQVSGGSRWQSFDEYARLDLYYVDNWSIWTDLAILAKTVPAVLFSRSNH